MIKFFRDNIIPTIGLTYILALASIGVLAAWLSRDPLEVDRKIESRVFNECTANIRHSLSDDDRLEWVKRCEAMAKSLATKICKN